MIFCLLLIFFQNLLTKNLSETIRVSKIFDPDHDQGFEGPNLGSNCSQRVSVQDKSGH